jgi:hypothetical protein
MRLPVLLLLFLASACSAAAPNDCAGLADAPRAALKKWVGGVYSGGGGIDSEGVESDRKLLIGHGREILPCLITLYRQGPAGVGMWERKEPAPPSARWALNLIQAIDRDTAVGLYREWRAEPSTDAMKQTEIDISLGQLGDSEALGRLAKFLEAAPPTGVDSDRLRNAREAAVTTVAAQNYRPALQGVRRLAGQANPPSTFWQSTVPVYIAQLSDDVPGLTRYAHDQASAIPALQALKRMGRDDLLRSLAADMNYRFQGTAKSLLETAPPGAEAVKQPR